MYRNLNFFNLEKIIKIKKVRNRAKNDRKEDISIIIQNCNKLILIL